MNRARRKPLLLPCLVTVLVALFFNASRQYAAAGAFPPRDLVTASLVADTTAISPGKPFTMGIRVKLKEGWHTYWEFSGDSGAAPQIEWTLPTGFVAGPIQWPLPSAHLDDDLVTYVYEGEVLLMTEITPPASLSTAEVKLAGTLKWLACQKTCIPGETASEITLPVNTSSEPTNADLFAKWRTQLPSTSPAPFSVQWDTSRADSFSLIIKGDVMGKNVEFFPLPPGDAKTATPVIENTDDAVQIAVPISSGEAANLAWRGVVTVTQSDGARKGWLIAAPGHGATESSTTSETTASKRAAPPKTLATGIAQTQVTHTSRIPKSLGALLLAAFLGGLILNVMPCVLPVIALKIFGFVHQAGEDPKKVFRLGLAFAAGVFVFFQVMAVITIILHTFGRDFSLGYQFQNPYLLAGMVSLLFVFGLNLLGVFEITLSGETTTTLSKLSGHKGYAGAFAHGLFTTLLGTSCTAPFLGSTLAGLSTQSAPMICIVFLAIGAGMSLPYVLLCAKPGWLRYLPKPGIWMERLRQVIGFIILAVGVWLFGVFISGWHSAAGSLAGYLLLLGMACWLVGVLRTRAVSVPLAIVIAIGGYFQFLKPSISEAESAPVQQALIKPAAEGEIAWEPFSEEKMSSAIESRKPLFIDFTADWCINCKVYERTVLDTKAIQEAFAQHHIVALRADWTKNDPLISKWLKHFGGAGVPLYVLYRPGEDQPFITDTLTPQILLNQLQLIRE